MPRRQPPIYPLVNTMAAPAEQRIAVPIDDPNADTEWYAPASLEIHGGLYRPVSLLTLVPGMRFYASMASSLRNLRRRPR